MSRFLYLKMALDFCIWERTWGSKNWNNLQTEKQRILLQPHKNGFIERKGKYQL